MSRIGMLGVLLLSSGFGPAALGDEYVLRFDFIEVEDREGADGLRTDVMTLEFSVVPGDEFQGLSRENGQTLTVQGRFKLNDDGKFRIDAEVVRTVGIDKTAAQSTHTLSPGQSLLTGGSISSSAGPEGQNRVTNYGTMFMSLDVPPADAAGARERKRRIERFCTAETRRMISEHRARKAAGGR